MENDNSKVVDITPRIKSSNFSDDNIKMRAKYHSNPIFKKFLVINVNKNSFEKFKVSDLFE